jgi:ABC-type dipeptide/oligopeptide/nickel transport system permease component/ABC-type transport system substrate-binding protein
MSVTRALAPLPRWLLALMGVLTLLAAAPVAHAAGGHILRLGQQLEPPSLDPSSGPASAIREVSFRTLFEGLVQLSPQGQPQPLLADSWTRSADGRTYVFALHPGVRFHDGAPMDAAAVKFSLERAGAEASTNGQKAEFRRIERIDVLDPTHVRVMLKGPYSGFLYLLGMGDAVIVSPGSAAGDRTHPVGTGPYRFETWRRGDSVTLTRNPAYWRAPARLDGIIIRFISDPSAAVAALQAGDLDGFPAFPAPEALSDFSRNPRFVVQTGGSEAKTLLAMNNAAPPFNDLRVRRAMTLAIDRKAVIRGAMFGYGRPISSHFTPLEDGYLDLTGAYPHDPARARALLAEAGYPHGFDTLIRLPPLPYARRSAEMISAQLAEVGVRAKLENLEWAQWLDQVFKRHDFQLSLVAHVEPRDLGIYARTDYYFGYRSPAYQALMAQMDSAADEASYTRSARAAQQLLSDDAVNVWLFEYPAMGVFRKEVSDIWRPTPVGAVDLYAARMAGPKTAGPVAHSESSDLLGGLSAWGLAIAMAALAALATARQGVRWIVQRFVSLILTLAAATVVIIVLLQIAPGDPAAFMMGLNPDPGALKALRVELGLEAPPLQRYFSWIRGLFAGDLGLSYTYRAPVAELAVERLAVTLPLTVLAILMSSLIALATALACARKPGGRLDRMVGVVTALGIAVPGFWLGLLLVALFSAGLHWTSAGGFPGWANGAGPALSALILPAIALATPQAAILTRVLREALVKVMGEDFIRTARAKGLSETAILFRHALPNALAPALTVLGLQFGFLLAGAVIVENVFFLPGLGRLVFQAVAQRDLMVVQGCVLILVSAVTLTAFVVDLLAALLDPRLSGKGAGS